jgi:ubiquinone/menaquinone biosynthesis C-methylase UbiE
LKLHLGCGNRYIEGYVHIDAVEFDHIDHIGQIDQLPYIATDSVDLIYACHVLEHFKRNDFERVLIEWNRVLKPKGILRLAVPDFEMVTYLYNKNKNLNEVIGLVLGKQDYLYNIHYNIFDFNSLKSSLLKVGFVNVDRYDWRDTEHSHVDDYSQAYIPHMDKENGILVSLNVECEKY